MLIIRRVERNLIRPFNTPFNCSCNTVKASFNELNTAYAMFVQIDILFNGYTNTQVDNPITTTYNILLTGIGAI